MKTIIIECTPNVVVVTMYVPSVFGVFERWADGNTTFAIHDQRDGRRWGLLGKILKDHVGMSSGHDLDGWKFDEDSTANFGLKKGANKAELLDVNAKVSSMSKEHFQIPEWSC